MTPVVGIHIDSPWAFLLLLPLVLLTLRGLTARRPSLLVASARPYREASPALRISPVHIPLLLEALGGACLIVALARPQQGTEEQVQRAEGIDIMLALDASGSMQNYDVEPHLSERKIAEMINIGKLKPRIQVAKDEVARFIDQRPNDRIGLLAFASHTYTICPPTLDHAFLKQHLARLEAGKLGPATNIAAPIGNATIRLKDSKAKRRVLVLFTDGVETEEIHITPMQAAKIASKFDIVMHTVGIGGGRTYGVDRRWNRLVVVRESFNDALMTQMAEETGGRYFKAAEEKGFRKVMEAIDELETVEMEVPRYVDYHDLHIPWMRAGLLLLLIGLSLEYTLFLKVP
jgi:Ca-activated chloride channel family protein